MNQSDMLARSQELGEKYRNGIKDAFSAATDFYRECGEMNGMSYKYELCKIFDTFDSLKTMFDKIQKRVDGHIKDVSDPDEFRRLKERTFTDDDETALSSLSFEEPEKHVSRLRSSESTNIDDILADEPTVKRLRH